MDLASNVPTIPAAAIGEAGHGESMGTADKTGIPSHFLSGAKKQCQKVT
jgi:hypothetical protein